MHIGILTFHNAINYGAVIQCYSLMTFLKHRGHDVEIIDYRVPSIEEYRKPFSFQTLLYEKSLRKKLSYVLNFILLKKRKDKVIKVFDHFVNKKLNLSKKVILVQDISQQYDYILFGSDQIWNLKLTNGFDNVFWGDFKKGKAVFATYAASMGEVDSVSNSCWKIIANKLQNFDFISVRELALKEYLEKKIRITVDYCIDPTFLIDSKMLDSLSVKPKEDNFIYFYNVTKDKNAEAFAIHVANILGCKVIKTDPKPILKKWRNRKCHLVEAISPEEFLGYIKYSRLVIGNSFHAIALSIVFRKDFYSLDSYRPGRIKSLLDSLGYLNRHLKSTNLINEVIPVDYTYVEEKLDNMRCASLSYIKKIGL